MLYSRYGVGLLLGSLASLHLFAQTETTDTTRMMETLVVTGQYAPQSLKNSVYKVRVIDRERIRLRGATDVIGVLNNEAGIRFSPDFALGETDISLMGVSGQNVKILLDGIPLTDRGGSRQSLSQIDINTIERIEIVEGPMSVTYGSDALAGVINIITIQAKTGLSKLSLTARVQEESAGSTYAPFNGAGVHQEHLGAQWSKGRWQASAHISRHAFGGFRDTAAAPQFVWRPKDQWLGGLSAGYRHLGFSARYRLDYLNEKISSLGAINPNTYTALDQYYLTARFTHQLQTEWISRKGLRLNSALSYQDYQRRTESYFFNYQNNSETPTNPALPGNEGQWDLVPFRNVFFRTTASWKPASSLSIQPGVEIKTDRTSGQRIAGRPQITDYSVFASAEYQPLAALTLRPGLRFSKNSVYEAPPVIPSLLARLSMGSDWELRLSYARGFRAPILRELYFLFRDGNHDIQGNTALKAEYSNSYQASLSWQAPAGKRVRLRSTVSGFYNDFNNRIELAAIPNTTVFTYINVSNYKTTGLTVENTASWRELSATVNAAFIGRFNRLSDETTFEKDGLPSFTWSPELSANLSYRFRKLGAEAGFFYKYTGTLPSYQVDANGKAYLARQADYHLADLTLSKSLWGVLTLQAGIKNLFNLTRLQNTAQATGSAHSASGPLLIGYGRSYFAGLQYQWNR